MTLLSKNARVAGLLYLVSSVVGLVRLMYIPNALIVHGNATATANNIVAQETLFRLGIVSELLGSVLWLFVPLALYRLLKEVDHGLAVLMVILGGLIQVPISFINSATDAGACCLPAAPIFSRFSTSRSATLSPSCSSTCIISLTWPMRFFGAYGYSHSACWCTDRTSFPAPSESG